MQRKIAPIYDLINANSIAILSIIIGIAWALFQLIYDRSVWLDEAMLANNIINRNFLALILPLDNNQLAPIGYLLLLKATGLIFNYHSIALRAVSVIAYIGCLYYSFILFRFLIKNQIAFLLSICLLVFNPILLYYATEIKPYIFDVLATLIIIYYTIITTDNTKKITTLFFAFFIFFFLSHITIFLLPGSFLYLFFNSKIKTKQLFVFTLFLALLLVFSGYYFSLLHHHPSSTHLQNYWESQNVFFDLKKPYLFYEKIKQIYSNLFLQFCSIDCSFVFFCIVFFSGVFVIVRQKKFSFLLLLLSPIFIHLLLSVLHLYPLESRLSLYSIPIANILIGVFFSTFLEKINIKSPQFFSLVSAVVLFTYIFIFFKKTDFPFQREEIKPLLEILHKKTLPTETIFIYYASKPAFDFYKTTNSDKIANIQDFGMTTYTSLPPFETELQTMPVGKHWLLLSHEYHGEIAHTIDYIQTHFHLLKIYHTKGAWLLYFEKL